MTLEERTPIEVLARLNPHAIDLLPMPPGYETLTAADISHALSFVKPKGAALLGRILIAQQEFLPELKHELVLVLKIEASRLKWRNIGPLPRLAEATISGYVTQRRCKRCKNVRSIIIQSKPMICPICKGMPIRPVFGTEIAEVIGVGEDQYRETWKRRFGFAWDTLMSWHGSCSDGLKKALKRFDKPPGFRHHISQNR